MTIEFREGEDYINYGLGSLMVVCFLISSCLNPLIYYSRTKKPRTIQNSLFKVIAATDFLTNLIPAVFLCYVFFSSIHFEYTLANQIPEFFACTFGCISQVTTTMMAVTRMISLMRPFLHIKFKYVYAYLSFYTVYMSIGNTGSLVVAGLKEHDEQANSSASLHSDITASDLDLLQSNNTQVIETLHMLNRLVCFSMNMLHCALGIVCSIITVVHLRCNILWHDPDQSGKLRSCTTILLMNIPYTLVIVSNFLAFYKVIKLDFKLVNHYLLPILTSTYNPCVIVWRTDAIKVARAPKVRPVSMVTLARAYSAFRAPMVLVAVPLAYTNQAAEECLELDSKRSLTLETCADHFQICSERSGQVGGDEGAAGGDGALGDDLIVEEFVDVEEDVTVGEDVEELVEDVEDLGDDVEESVDERVGAIQERVGDGASHENGGLPTGQYTALGGQHKGYCNTIDIG